MSTLIFRTLAPTACAAAIMLSLAILLRGHNAPGGGFVGGLAAAAGLAVYAMAAGVAATRRALRVNPLAIAGAGVLLALLSGLPSLLAGTPYLTGFWAEIGSGEGGFSLSTPLVFDIGVYLAVFGAFAAIALALEEDGGEG